MGNLNNVWSSIQRLLVVVPFNQVESVIQWRDAIKLCGLNINDCVILSIVGSKKERLALTEMASVVYLADGDFGLLGRLKNEVAQRVISNNYDAVLIVGDQPRKVAKAVRKIRSNLEIGLNTSDDYGMINLRTEETSPKYMLNFVKLTVEKIS